MQVDAGLDAPCPADVLFGLVDDLGAYPQWLDLVARAVPDERVHDDGVDRLAWMVDLRASIGPLTRSKRLRMIRTVHDIDGHEVVFERAELDGRRHARWTLRAQVVEQPDGSGSTLAMTLRYGGALWTGGLLERALSEQIVSGRERLLKLIETTR